MYQHITLTSSGFTLGIVPGRFRLLKCIQKYSWPCFSMEPFTLETFASNIARAVQPQHAAVEKCPRTCPGICPGTCPGTNPGTNPQCEATITARKTN